MLRHAVEADKEFCLSCELGFLFRMLFAAKGQACQVCGLWSQITHPAAASKVMPALCIANIVVKRLIGRACSIHGNAVPNSCPQHSKQQRRAQIARLGTVQASNLLRALRQNREAGALGLLEVRMQVCPG